MADTPNLNLPPIPSTFDKEQLAYLTALTKVLQQKQNSDYSAGVKMQEAIDGTMYKKGTAIFSHSENGYQTITIAPGVAIPVFVNTIYNDSDSISILSTTQIKLLAGKKYRLTGQHVGIESGLNWIYTKFYNITSSSYIGSESRTTCVTDTGNVNNSNFAEAVICPTVDTTIEFRNFAGSGAGTITAIYSGTKVIVEEVEAYLPASVISYKRGTALFMPAAQSGITDGIPMQMFETAVFNDSESIIKISNTQIQLKAGKKYLLRVSVRIGVATYAHYRFYNYTAGTYSALVGIAISTTYASVDTSQQIIEHIVAPTVDSIFEIRAFQPQTGFSIHPTCSYIIIEEVEAYLPIVTEGYSEIDQSISGAVSKIQCEIGAGIIETGSNTNGRWIKFSDGTMICWKYPLSMAAHAINTQGADTIWTYPSGYYENPVILKSVRAANGTGSQSDSGTLLANGWYEGTYATYARFSCYSYRYAQVDPVLFNAFAIGRWKA